MQPQAQVLINLMPDGNVAVQFTGANKTMYYGMLETAKDLIRAKIEEQQRGPGLQIPSAELVPVLNGRRMG